MRNTVFGALAARLRTGPAAQGQVGSFVGSDEHDGPGNGINFGAKTIIVGIDDLQQHGCQTGALIDHPGDVIGRRHRISNDFI